MQDKEAIVALERVNLEYLNVINSKQYRLGQKIYNFLDCLKRGRILEIIKRLKKNKSKSRYTSFPLTEFNEFKVNGPKQNRTDIKPRIAVYTCIVGKYDCIIDPYYVSDNCSYYVFSDEAITTKVWKKKDIPSNIKRLNSPILINRYIKMHPAELFPQYDFAIYVDGKVTIISDLSSLIFATSNYYGIAMHRHTYRTDIFSEIDACISTGKGNVEKLGAQGKKYKEAGMPSDFGMLEAAVIVSDLSNSNGAELFNRWWDEFVETKSMRDQVSLPFLIWEDGKTLSDIGSLGAHIEVNPKFRINGSHIVEH